MPRYFEDPDKWEKAEKHKFLPALAARSWYLVVPLIAVWWFHTKTVVPQLAAIDQKIAGGPEGNRVDTQQDLGRGARAWGGDIQAPGRGGHLLRT